MAKKLRSSVNSGGASELTGVCPIALRRHSLLLCNFAAVYENFWILDFANWVCLCWLITLKKDAYSFGGNRAST